MKGVRGKRGNGWSNDLYTVSYMNARSANGVPMHNGVDMDRGTP